MLKAISTQAAIVAVCVCVGALVSPLAERYIAAPMRARLALREGEPS